MRILYLSPTGAWGGAERVLMSVMTGVRRANPDVRPHLLALSGGPLVERAAQAGFETTVQTLPDALASLGDSQLKGKGRIRTALSTVRQTLSAGGAAWCFVRALRQTIGRLAPELIHSNGIKTHCLAGFAGPGKAALVWHVHDFTSTRPLARRLLRLASGRLAAAIAISHAVAADLKTLGLAAPTEVIANVVDVNDFAPAAQDGAMLDRLAGMSPAEPACLRVGLIATYARWKGQDVFLKAAARLIQENPARRVRFYIIGGPIYQTRGSQFEAGELQEMARRLGVEGSLGLIGFQSNIVPAFRALDVVVHASTAPEPFGLTIIEAMACAKPVVATLAGGVVDIIRPGHDGLGVPPGDAAALAGALQTLLADAALRQRLGANARETVCQRFNENRLGPQMLDFYERILDPHRGKENLQLGKKVVVAQHSN